jgi:hypothetical protein
MNRPELKKTLLDHAAGKQTLCSVQYFEFSQDEWTIPALLTQEGAMKILDDNSIKTIRLIVMSEIIFLVP